MATITITMVRLMAKLLLSPTLERVMLERLVRDKRVYEFRKI